MSRRCPLMRIPCLVFTGLAQLVEHWSPKPGVGSSSLSTRANINRTKCQTLYDTIKDSFEELKNNVAWTTGAENSTVA